MCERAEAVLAETLQAEVQSVLTTAGAPLALLETADLVALTSGSDYPDSDDNDEHEKPADTSSWSVSGGKRDASFKRKLSDHVAAMELGSKPSSSSFVSTPLYTGLAHRDLGSGPNVTRQQLGSTDPTSQSSKAARTGLVQTAGADKAIKPVERPRVMTDEYRHATTDISTGPMNEGTAAVLPRASCDQSHTSSKVGLSQVILTDHGEALESIAQR